MKPDGIPLFLRIILLIAVTLAMICTPGENSGPFAGGPIERNRTEGEIGVGVAAETSPVRGAGRVEPDGRMQGVVELPLAAMRIDPGLRQELLRYAKEYFLARLGMGKGVAPPELARQIQRACFVTFYSGRKVIACYGGFSPRKSDLVAEIEDTVKLALLRDPRAMLIDRETAMRADVQITFPGEPEAVASYADVDPIREGMLVENDREGVAIVPGEAKTAAWAFRDAVRRLGEKDPAQLRVFKFRAYAISSRNLSDGS
ncbi:MAG: AMMECR1 domain-containing protein [Deltaproteobacteria bacterium]